jgi:hypothetical protein
MTFTYNLNDGFSNLERVRFHIGDMDSTTARFQDEEINAIITEEGSWEKAVIACLKNLIARLSVPDFRADWLEVKPSTARAAYEALLKQKQKDFGLSNVVMEGVHVYRADSDQTAAPDYSEGAKDAWLQD